MSVMSIKRMKKARNGEMRLHITGIRAILYCCKPGAIALSWFSCLSIFSIMYIMLIHIQGFDVYARELEADPNTGIKAVLSLAVSGDTVIIRKGMYQDTNICLYEGITLMGDSNALGSVIISGKPDKITIYSYSYTTIRNLVIRDGKIGISCVGDNNITIDHNLIIHNYTGIFIISDQVTFTHNTVAYNEGRGISILEHQDGPALNVKGNIIAFNGDYGGIEFFCQAHPASGVIIKGLSFSYNDVYDWLYYKWLDDGYDVIDLVQLSLAELSGICNISEDPCFIDPNVDDYRLLSYSPCIDKGDPNIAGLMEALPNGGRPNLGFYGNTIQAATSIDTDGDGQMDFEEGTGDADGDGLPDWMDNDTAAILLPWGTERVWLCLEDAGMDSAGVFEDAKAIDAANPSNPELTLPEGFVPFGVISFKIKGVNQGDKVAISMILPERYGALDASNLMALGAGSTWEAIPSAIDPNRTGLIFHVQDGSIEDRDNEAGDIEVCSAVVIYVKEDWDAKGSCFVSGVYYHH